VTDTATALLAAAEFAEIELGYWEDGGTIDGPDVAEPVSMETNDDDWRSDGDWAAEAAGVVVVVVDEMTGDDSDAAADFAVVVDDCILALAVVTVPTSLMTADCAVVTSLTVNNMQCVVNFASLT
jgi:hypothetical protein